MQYPRKPINIQGLQCGASRHLPCRRPVRLTAAVESVPAAAV